MKILHAADWHLDTAFTGHTDADARYLKKMLLSVPEQIAQLCAQHGCDLLLLSGDLFDGPASRESIDALQKMLSAVKIPTFITPGNHDFCAPGSPYLSEVWPENVHIFTKPAMECHPLPALDCCIYGAGYTGMDCAGLLENFRAEGDARWHIGIVHGDPMQRNAPYCPITQSQVADSALHYLALGHIHKAGQFTAGETLCAWPGCPMGRGNDETGEKGVYLVTLGESVSLEFLPLNVPKFYDLEAEVITSPQDALRAALPPVGNDDFYRITLTGECEPFDILSFPGFPHLQIRDKTVAPVPVWDVMGEDSLEGLYFKLLHDSLETADEETVLLAAKISRKILDGREVTLP